LQCRNGGGADPFVRGREYLSNIMSLGQAYLRTIWHLDPHSRFATVDASRSLRRHACTHPETAKVAGLLCSFPGGAAGSPSNIMSPGLRPKLNNQILHIKWHLDASSRLAALKVGPKLGAVPPFFGEGSWVPVYHNVAGLDQGPPPCQVPS